MNNKVPVFFLIFTLVCGVSNAVAVRHAPVPVSVSALLAKDKDLANNLTIATAVGIVEGAEGNILIIKRAKTPEGWAFPGGRLEISTGECSAQAVIRELKEEVGVKVKMLPLQLYTTTSPVCFPEGQWVSLTQVCYIVPYGTWEYINQGTAVMMQKGEVQQYEWVNVDFLKNLPTGPGDLLVMNHSNLFAHYIKHKERQNKHEERQKFAKELVERIKTARDLCNIIESTETSPLGTSPSEEQESKNKKLIGVLKSILSPKSESPIPTRAQSDPSVLDLLGDMDLGASVDFGVPSRSGSPIPFELDELLLVER